MNKESQNKEKKEENNVRLRDHCYTVSQKCVLLIMNYLDPALVVADVIFCL